MTRCRLVLENNSAGRVPGPRDPHFIIISKSESLTPSNGPTYQLQRGRVESIGIAVELIIVVVSVPLSLLL